VIPTIFKDPHCWADYVDGFILVAKQTDKKHIVAVEAFVGPAYLVRQNSASDIINSIWLVNNHVDLNMYWTLY